MKTLEMNCYELLEADGYGESYIHVGYVNLHGTAAIWKARNPTYRRVTEYIRTITIFDTIEELDDFIKNALIKSAKTKLSVDECRALGIL